MVSVSEAGGPGLGSSLARAFCAESARALKAFFSFLCVSSKSASLLGSKFGQKSPNFARAELARFLGQGLVPARGQRSRFRL